MRNFWAIIIAKSFGVGASMLMPGFSGGSIAIILNIYDRIIQAVGYFRRDIRANAQFLALFCLGGALGMFTLAQPLLLLYTRFPVSVTYLFMGAAMGSIPILLGKARLRRWRWQLLLWPLLGAAIVLGFSALRQAAFSFGEVNPGGWLLLLAGLFSSVAFVLPGLSVSYIWLMMGIYEATMQAIGGFQLGYLLPLGLGLLLGTLLCTRLLAHAMRYYPGATYLTIVGVLLSSLVEIFPGLPVGMSWLLCPALFALGLLAVWLLGKAAKA